MLRGLLGDQLLARLLRRPPVEARLIRLAIREEVEASMGER